MSEEENIEDDLNIEETQEKGQEDEVKYVDRERKFVDRPVEEIFNIVYDTRDWTDEESISGTGSTLKSTEGLINELPRIFEKYDIKRVLDVACGDFNWFQKVVPSLNYYKGTDIVQRLIDDNNEKYREEGKIEFEHSDLINEFEANGQFDAVIAKDVLVHFPYNSVFKSLKNLRQSGIKYLFLTHFNELPCNKNIKVHGQWHPLNFTKSPFNFDEPLEMIKQNETYTYGEEHIIMNDKTISLWKIND